MPVSTNMKGIILSASGFTIWALGDALIKHLTGFYSVSAIVFYNACIVTLLFLAAAPWLGGLKQTFRTKKMKLHLLRGFLFFLQIAFVIYGFSQMSMAKTYAIVFSSPFIASILSIPLLGEKITVKQWLAIALGFCGVLIVLRPGIIPLDMAALSVLAGALVFSLTNIIVRIIEKPGENSETMISWGLLPELVVLTCAFLMFLPQFALPAAEHIVMFILLAMTSAVGMIMISFAFRLAAPAVAAPFHYVQMLWGVVLGYLVFGDVLDFWTGLGASVIIASGLWLIWQEKNGSVAKTAAPLPPP